MSLQLQISPTPNIIGRRSYEQRLRRCAAAMMLPIGELTKFMFFTINLTYARVKSLESQITDLESESERISRALDNQRLATSEIEAMGTKKMDDLGRELHKKVCSGDIYLL